jgi:MFS family permease
VTRIPYKWELVGWLWLAFFLNQADREVFGVVLPSLKADLGLTDLQAGMVASIFTIALAVVVPAAGYMGDHFSRKRIVFVSLLAWSGATALTGFSTGIVFLIVACSLATSVGEGLYGPSAYALIAEHHVETRGTAMSIHQTALYIGVVSSGLIAGYLGDRFGWRSAFWVFGFGGILLALATGHCLRDTRARQSSETISVRLTLATLFRNRTVLLLCLAHGGEVFVNVVYLTWMPTYLHEHFGLTLANAGFFSMFWHYAASFVAVLLGGRLSDWLVQSHPRARILLQAGSTLAGAPFLYLLGTANDLPTACIAMAASGFFRGIYSSNTPAALYQVVSSKFRASAAALNITGSFVIGSSAPLAVGAVKQSMGLAVGLSGLAIVPVVASATLIAAAVTFQADYRKVSSAASSIVPAE